MALSGIYSKYSSTFSFTFQQLPASSEVFSPPEGATRWPYYTESDLAPDPQCWSLTLLQQHTALQPEATLYKDKHEFIFNEFSLKSRVCLWF